MVELLVLGVDARLLEGVAAVEIARELGLGGENLAGDDQRDGLIDAPGPPGEQHRRVRVDGQAVDVPAAAALAAPDGAVRLAEAGGVGLVALLPPGQIDRLIGRQADAPCRATLPADLSLGVEVQALVAQVVQHQRQPDPLADLEHALVLAGFLDQPAHLVALGMGAGVGPLEPGARRALDGRHARGPLVFG